MSFFAFLTALKYSEQSDATDPDIWITAITLAAAESPSIALLACGSGTVGNNNQQTDHRLW
jgi:hypothetical protein